MLLNHSRKFDTLSAYEKMSVYVPLTTNKCENVPYATYKEKQWLYKESHQGIAANDFRLNYKRRGERRMSILTKKEIQHALKDLNGWSLQKKVIKKEFRFVDFVHAIGFVNSVAFLAERVNHHPDMIIHWNKVMLVLFTHSEGGITKKDIALAKKVKNLCSAV